MSITQCERKKELQLLRKCDAVYEIGLAKFFSPIYKYILDNVIKKNICKCPVKNH